ncbi:DivIVA domain-containing protein [Solwaraspora sp. WMMD1047]|uniref:DivIVA domain-containing protein n=1 Tax=Solwaraspora sp. WMMD1047 TaxID=3016102 RepID=UPI0024169150|nr:DivIVA domain-containing protein [Solwaraspora sp. WMMD1047]MDG4828143.1 DivIVA domain-containing protein [Solwaraspora sp. WMMD1047]
MRRLLDLLIPGRVWRRTRKISALDGRARRPERPAGAASVRRMPNVGGHYRYDRPVISPGQVRGRRFPDRTRRGCDPREVGAFLDLVADELAALRGELATTRDENLRIKQALRDWQGQFRRPGACA